MKWTRLMVMGLAAVVAVAGAPVSAAIFSDTNLIPAAAASFEDVSNWNVHSWAYISDPPEPTNSGDHAHVFHDTRDGYPTSWYPITTVGNREHYLSAYVREPNGPLNLRRLRLGTGLFNISAGGTGNFAYRGGQLHLDGSGVVQVNFGINVQQASSTRNRRCIFDAVAVERERVLPLADSDSTGGAGVTPGVETTVSLFNSGGDEGTYNIFFDPDIQVVSPNALVSNVQWVSDTQIDVTLTGNAPMVNLTLTNAYSDLSSDYTIVPEPLTLALLGLGSVALIRRRR